MKDRGDHLDRIFKNETFLSFSNLKHVFKICFTGGHGGHVGPGVTAPYTYFYICLKSEKSIKYK